MVRGGLREAEGQTPSGLLKSTLRPPSSPPCILPGTLSSSHSRRHSPQLRARQRSLHGVPGYSACQHEDRV